MFAFKTIIWGTIFSFAALIAGPFIAMQFEQSFPAIDLEIFRYIGIILMAFSIPIAIYCAAIIILPSKNKPRLYHSEELLIISGPYKFVRNPFMLAIMVSVWGESIYMSETAMFAYAFIFSWCLHFWVVFFEEPSLKESFKGDYLNYSEEVPRWIPSLKEYRLD